jgi:hypothetical protein
MFQKPNTIIACLHSERSDYILELNKFIRKNDPNITILATENKKIYAKGQ